MDEILGRVRYSLHGSGVVNLLKLAFMDHFEDLRRAHPSPSFVAGFDVTFPYLRRLLELSHETLDLFVIENTSDEYIVALRDDDDTVLFDRVCEVMLGRWSSDPRWGIVYELTSDVLLLELDREKEKEHSVPLPMWKPTEGEGPA